MIVVTEKNVYFFERKGIRFWLVVLMCKLRGIEYDIIEDF